MMSARCLCLALALLASSCHARGLQEAMAPAMAPMDPAAACDAVTEGNVDAPANAIPASVVEAVGTRNFTCVDGKVKDSFAVANVTGDWEGMLYYAADGVGTFAVMDPETGDVLGDILLISPPALLPAAPGELPDARWRISGSTGQAPPFAYLTRANSTGGGAPEPCDAPEGEWVLEPFTTVYTFHTCE